MTFHVLFICTGNICRSPMAERLFLARLPAGAPLSAASAGTHGLAGHAMDGPSAALLRELGGEPNGHAGRLLTIDLVTAADLVLTAGTSHRQAIERIQPDEMARTFTMREFARLGASMGALPSVTPQALRERVAAVHASRTGAPRPPKGADEITDPFGARPDVTRASALAVSDAVDGVLAALGVRDTIATSTEISDPR